MVLRTAGTARQDIVPGMHGNAVIPKCTLMLESFVEDANLTTHEAIELVPLIND